MKSGIRIWVWAAIAAIGLLGAIGAAGVRSEETSDRLRDDPRRQRPSVPSDAVLRPAAGLVRATQETAPAAQNDTVAAPTDVLGAQVSRYIPLAVPGAAVLLLVCVAAIWHLAL